MDKNVFFPKLSPWLPRGLVDRSLDQSIIRHPISPINRSSPIYRRLRGTNARLAHPGREWSRRELVGHETRRRKHAKTKSRREDMSGVGFLAAVKTFTPGGRRRRRCEKQQKVLELPPGYGMQPDVVPPWDAAPPITPPAAFLPPGYKKGFPGELAQYKRSRVAKTLFAYGVKRGDFPLCKRCISNHLNIRKDYRYWTDIFVYWLAGEIACLAILEEKSSRIN